VLELTIWLLRDMPRVDWDNNSTLMESQEQLDHNNGRTMLWKSNPMVVALMSGLPQASIQDGGNSSRKMEPLLSMREERF
jgi:hypothetical protein